MCLLDHSFRLRLPTPFLGLGPDDRLPDCAHIHACAPPRAPLLAKALSLARYPGSLASSTVAKVWETLCPQALEAICSCRRL